MTRRAALFRREAVEFQAGGGTEGGRLEVDRPGDRWLSRLVLALLLVGAVVCLVVRVDETASGPAVVDVRAGRFVALVPSAAVADPVAGLPVRLRLVGQGESLVGTVVTSSLVDEEEARRAGLPASGEPGQLLTGTLASARVEAVEGSRQATAVVVLRSDRVATMLARQLGDLSGGGAS